MHTDIASKLSSTTGRIAQTTGGAVVSTADGVADVIGHGGSGVVAVWDGKGYNVASVADGEAHARSGNWPGTSDTVEYSRQPMPVLDEGPRGLDPRVSCCRRGGWDGSCGDWLLCLYDLWMCRDVNRVVLQYVLWARNSALHSLSDGTDPRTVAGSMDGA